MCTLSVRLLFHSRMDLGLAMKSARRPDQALGGGQVAERIHSWPHTNGTDGRSRQLADRLRRRRTRGCFLLSVARQRVGCAAAYVLAAESGGGGKLQPSGERAVRAGVGGNTALPTSQR